MAKKTITQALRDLFLGLGGDSAQLADNQTISDYVDDLESAITGLIPSGGSSDFIIPVDNITPDSSYKFADMLEAYENGANIYLEFVNNSSLCVEGYKTRVLLTTIKKDMSMGAPMLIANAKDAYSNKNIGITAHEWTTTISVT